MRNGRSQGTVEVWDHGRGIRNENKVAVTRDRPIENFTAINSFPRSSKLIQPLWIQKYGTLTKSTWSSFKSSTTCLELMVKRISLWYWLGSMGATRHLLIRWKLSPRVLDKITDPWHALAKVIRLDAFLWQCHGDESSWLTKNEELSAVLSNVYKLVSDSESKMRSEQHWHGRCATHFQTGLKMLPRV